jgi:hypothetical protein
MKTQQFKFMKFAAVAVLALVSVSSQRVRADDATAQKAFEDAKTQYAARSGTALGSIEKALGFLDTAEAQAVDKTLKYDILILASRAMYFKGTHTSGNDNKKAIHSAAQAKAEAAEALMSDYTEAPYYAGINLARWGEANGIVSSVKQVPKLKKLMADAMERSTRTDDSGEAIDGFGPHRVLGRMLKKLPGFLGGSHAESVAALEKAVKGAPTTALNVVYLADSLIKDGKDNEKAEGRKLLNDLLAQDMLKFNTDRMTETAEEFQLARDVLAGKEIQ